MQPVTSTPAHLTPAMPNVRRGYVDIEGGQVHIRTAGTTRGTRPPLLCLHMSPASGIVYERFAAQMGTTRLVIAPDTPGFGASDATDREPEIRDYARVMANLVESLEVPVPVDVMGYHTGSMIAVELAAERPDLVRRVVAVSLPIFDQEEVSVFRELYRADPLFDQTGELLLRRWRWFRDFFGVQPHGPNSIVDAGRIFIARLSGGERHWWGHQAAFRYELARRLVAVAAPIMVLNPDDDLTVQTLRAAAYLRTGRVIEAPQWTHGYLDRHPQEAAVLVGALLDE